MTIKNRNRIFFFLIILSSVIFSAESIFFIIAAAKKAIVPPANPVRTFVLFPADFLCPYNFKATAASIFLFGIFSIVLSVSLYKGFEKTPSLEILFFSGLILSCIAEGTRIFLPMFGLWKTNSLFLITLGRIVSAGRILAPLSVFFASLFSGAAELQYAERNIVILLATACIFGMLYPMNTTVTTSSCTMLWGFKGLFVSLRVIIFLSSLLSILVEAYSRGIKELYVKSLGLFLLALGYGILCSTDCWLEFFVAGIFCISGGIVYLKTIHFIADNWD